MKNLVVILSFFLLSNASLHSQNPEWIVFPFDSIGVPNGTLTSIAIDSTDNIWFTSFNSNPYIQKHYGVIKYDGSNFTIYDTTNSDLQNNYVYTLCVDKENNLWAGYYNFKPHSDEIGGISKFENNKWLTIQVEKSKNVTCLDIEVGNNGNLWFTDGSGLLKYDYDKWSIWNAYFFDDFPILLMPQSIKVDHNENVWIGTSWDEMPSNAHKGLLKFDGDTCEFIQDKYNSQRKVEELFGGYRSIAEDKQNNIWAARDLWGEDGLLMVNDTGWALYNRSNSGLPCDSISKIAFDKNDIMWLATWKSLVKWDGATWKHWHTGNSNIPFNKIETLDIDRFGNIWIGGYNYLACFREGGVILKTEENNNKSESVQCYPNPFSESTTIKYYLYKPDFVKLKVYDALGQEVSVLVNSYIKEGEHQVRFDSGNLTDGIYYYKLITGDKVEFGKMILIR